MNNTVDDELYFLLAFLLSSGISVWFDKVLLNVIFSFDAKGLPTGDLFAKESGKQLAYISYNCTEDVYISADN